MNRVNSSTINRENSKPEFHQSMKTPTASIASHSLEKNYLLAQLSSADQLRLLPHMELYSLEVDEVIHETGMPIEWIYFPISAIVCIGCIAENGSTPSVGLVGKDGLVGLAAVLGSAHAAHYASVQTPGLSYRIKTRQLKNELHHNSDLLQIALLYSQLFFTQISQTAVCNRLHSVEQQLCRYLLMNADLLEKDDMYLTHESIANMLGVRREGITHAAGKLQQKSLIRYNRGKIHILDKDGLENEACECYAAVNHERARLMPTSLPLCFHGSNKNGLVLLG